MILVIHGEDTSKSRGTITSLQKKLNIKNKVELDISVCASQDVYNAISTRDLFGEFPLVVIDISNVGRKNCEEYLNVLKKASKEINIIIYSSKQISPSNIFVKNLNAKIIENKLEPNSNAFKFADAVFLKNRSLTYKELEKLLLDDVDSIYEIFPALVWKLRILSYAVFKSPDLEKQKPYVKQSAIQLAKKYNEEEIKRIYKVFYETDKKVKTGELSREIFINSVIEKIL